MENLSEHKGVIRPYEAKLNFATRLLDILLIAAALWVASFVHGEEWRNTQSLAAIGGGVAFYIAAQMLGLYQTGRGGRTSRTIKIVWGAWALAYMALLLLAFATKTSADHSRRVVLTWVFLAPATLTIWRGLLEAFKQEARARGHNIRKAAVVGASPLGLQLMRTIQTSPWMGLEFVGLYDDRSIKRLHEADPSVAKIHGTLEQLVAAAREGRIDHVYISLPPRAEPRIAELIRRLSDTTASVHLAYDFGGFDLLRAQWSSVGDIAVVSVVEQPFYGIDGLAKRVEDIVIGSLVLTLIAIPMIAIAVGVKLSSPGPVFFRQRRYGLNGEVVTVLKFRTMTVCEDGDHVVQASKDDQRVTPLGSFLRRTSLDEFPQFLQVISGAMSIVGPRPHAVAHNEIYRSQIQGYMLRHKVKPGITGWAQVNGWRGETDTLEKMAKRIEYDLDYIRGWHVGFDLRIIFLTIRQVLFGHKNAY